MIARCAEVWLVERDEARAWALVGAMSAERLRHHVDYGDAEFRAAVQALAEETDVRDRVEGFARQIAAGGWRDAAGQRH
jgi:hypothetical protein